MGILENLRIFPDLDLWPTKLKIQSVEAAASRTLQEKNQDDSSKIVDAKLLKSKQP